MTNLADPAPPDQIASAGGFPAPHVASAATVQLPPPPGFAAPPAPTAPAALAAAATPDASPSTQFVPPELPEYHPPTVAAAAAPPATPTVPTVAPAMPPVAATPSRQGSGLPDFNMLQESTTRHTARRSPVKRFFKLLFVMSLLGGLGAAGYVYGPEIVDKIREETSEGGTDPAEQAAPLAFPVQTAAPIEVRNATFVLNDQDDAGMSRRYQITTDFETRVAQVLIEREGMPTLEVLTFLDQAVVRRVGDDVWYRTARGQFPLDDQLERARWVRSLDELIPPTSRPHASIEKSTTTDLAGESMRRLEVSIERSLLAGPSIATAFDPPVTGAAPEPVDAVGTAGTAVDPANGVADPTVDGNVAVLDVDAEVPDDVAGGLESLGVPTVPVTGVGPVTIELWIDSRGLIRQIISPDVLGGEVLTVTSISPDSWLPEYPTEEQVEPLTASALVKLGL